MLSSFHIHTVFCDGDNTPEEVVTAAVEKGFSAIGFSGHGYTGFAGDYCLKDTDGYIAEINRLKNEYRDKIQIYLGAEEDAFEPVGREKFDYIIGSSHYFLKDGKYYPIDSNPEGFKACLEAFDYDAVKLSTAYYESFCDYILKRRPDIIGHFDLITKFDENDKPLFLNNADYHRVAEKYIAEAAKADCIFELNTGAISRGWRTTPYPYENLLYVLKRLDARLILSSDSHNISTLSYGFEEATERLRDIGFKHLYTLSGGKFVKYSI